jgi:predicted permease
MFSWNSLFSPPLVANLFALLLVLTGAKAFVPEPVVGATHMLGAATVPAATIVLGGVLGGMEHRFRAHLADAVRALSVKLLVIPLLTILVLSATSLRQTDPLLALVLVLQGASPPATNIVLQITTYGGNLERSGTIMLMGYIAALVTIPAWVAVWQVMG